MLDACEAHVGEFQEGDWDTKRTNVVAISVCDFELWPDAKQDSYGLPRVPMLSRWHMTERGPENHGLLPVQYAFLELPKVPAQRPEAQGAGLWAWLFVHAPELTEVPADLESGPYGEALELANKAKFTAGKLQAYEQARDEIRQVHEIVEARWAEGRAEGARDAKLKAELAGKIEGKIETLLRLVVRAGIALADDERARIGGCLDAETLDRWIENVIGAKTAADVLT